MRSQRLRHVLGVVLLAWMAASASAEVQLDLNMPFQTFLPGTTCWLKLGIQNSGAPYLGAGLFVALDVGTGDYWFWPDWVHYPPGLDWHATAIPVGADEVEIIPEFGWPAGCGSGGARFLAAVVTGSGLISNLAAFDFSWSEPGPPPTPTPTPPPEGPCQRGSAIVEVFGIPIMTNANKDEYNKQVLFCLRDQNATAFVGVWHRYLQPDWPYGDWWPAWRIEAGNADCTEEWSIWEAHDLPGTSARFLIEWDGHSTTVTHLGTGDSQSLHVDTVFGLHMLDDETCAGFSWSSDSRARLVSFSCQQYGPPSGCY